MNATSTSEHRGKLWGELTEGEGSIVAMAWKARDIYGVARSWSRGEIVQAFEWMLECDLSNKGGGEGSESVVTNIEILILNLCTSNRKKAARTGA